MLSWSVVVVVMIYDDMLRAPEWSPNSRMRETKESGCSVNKYGEIECTETSILNSFVVGVEI